MATINTVLGPLSTDQVGYTLAFDDDAQRDARRRANPDNYLFIHRNVLPLLREQGVSDDTLHQIMVENPRRFFDAT